MKKCFLAFLFALFLFPAFSLGVEASYLLPDDVSEGAMVFMAGLTTSNPIFNVSGGFYLDGHDIKLKHKVQVYREFINYQRDEYGNLIETPIVEGYWDTEEHRETKRDSTVGAYLKCDWSILPITIKDKAKIGTNLSLFVGAASDDLGGFELPLGANASLQVRYGNFDILAGVQVILYMLCSENIEDYNGGGGTFGVPIGLRYNFNAPAISAPKTSRTHIINGSGLSPSL